MANTQYAFLKRQNVPDREQLQASIDSLRFDLQLDPEFTPFDDEGFSPCTFADKDDIGFEILYENSGDIVTEDSELTDIAGENDFCIVMSWGGSMFDYAAVMIVSSALARDFGATISYEGNDPVPPKQLIDETESVIAEAFSQETRAREKAIIKRKIMALGKPEDIAKTELNKLVNHTLDGVGFGGVYMMAFSTGQWLSCKAFKCSVKNQPTIDITRRAKVRAKQFQLLEGLLGRDPTEEQEQEMDSVWEELEGAEAKDEEQYKKFKLLAQDWPESVMVTEVIWSSKDTIKIVLGELDVELELIAFDEMTSEISLKSEILQISFSNTTCKIED